MANIDLTSRAWDDMIFEGKNKEFGAYQMRRKSDKRHNLAALFTLIGLFVVALAVWGFSIYNNWQAELRAEEEARARAEAMSQAQFAEEEAPEEEQPEEQKFEQEIPEVKEEVLATVQVTQIAIVDADKVKNEVMTQEEQKQDDTARGVVNQEGSDDADRFKAVQEQVKVKEPEPEPKVVEKHEPEKIFTAVEQRAEFPGGESALYSWLQKNLRYPERAQQNDIQGRVIVRFVVNKDGSIEQVTVAKGVDKDLDQEAIRVVKRMPKWQPGKNNGQAVRSYFTLPVTFKLAR